MDVGVNTIDLVGSKAAPGPLTEPKKTGGSLLNPRAKKYSATALQFPPFSLDSALTFIFSQIYSQANDLVRKINREQKRREKLGLLTSKCV